METGFSPDEAAFRDECRDWLLSNIPREKRPVDAADAIGFDKAWQRQLFDAGWAGINWPVEYGGRGLSIVQQVIWLEEYAKAHAPWIGANFVGINHGGPTLILNASEEQKAYHLPRILKGEAIWCQGFSEPGAGSDLAGIKTRGRIEGDEIVINGSKIWTSFAHVADWQELVLRTEEGSRRHTGLSWVICDMHTPGITVRPIIMLDEEHEVNEVFFDNVKVPVENLIGEENKGWTYAKYLLGHERTNIAAVGRAKRELQFLKRVAEKQQKNGKPLLADPVFAAKVASLEIEIMALEITVLRVLSQEGSKRGPGPEASMLKVKGTEVQQMLTELMVEAVGPYALPFDPAYLEGEHEHSVTGDDDAAPLAPYYFNYRKTSIYGGSNEIQKNIITQMILGL